MLYCNILFSISTLAIFKTWAGDNDVRLWLPYQVIGVKKQVKCRRHKTNNHPILPNNGETGKDRIIFPKRPVQ
jgi:hypothetical protein